MRCGQWCTRNKPDHRPSVAPLPSGGQLAAGGKLGSSCKAKTVHASACTAQNGFTQQARLRTQATKLRLIDRFQGKQT